MTAISGNGVYRDVKAKVKYTSTKDDMLQPKPSDISFPRVCHRHATAMVEWPRKWPVISRRSHCPPWAEFEDNEILSEGLRQNDKDEICREEEEEEEEEEDKKRRER